MSTGNNIITTQGVRGLYAIATAAKTTYNDLVGAVELLSSATGHAGGANGGLLKRVVANPRATVTASQLQVYRDVGGLGTNLTIVGLLVMPAYTMAQTTAPIPSNFGFSSAAPLRLGPLDKIWVATGVALAGGISFDGEVEDF